MVLPSLLDLRCRGLWIWGVRTVWQTEGDGEFFCPRCGGDRNYSRRTGTRRLTVFNIPVLHRGSAGTVVECGVCQEGFALDALDQPTSSRFAAMLRDAVHTVTLAVLTAFAALAGSGWPAHDTPSWHQLARHGSQPNNANDG